MLFRQFLCVRNAKHLKLFALRLQIHDELLFELPGNQVDVERLKSVVTRACTIECAEELQLKVP